MVLDEISYHLCDALRHAFPRWVDYLATLLSSGVNLASVLPEAYKLQELRRKLQSV